MRDDYRMDIRALEGIIDSLAAEKRPVLAVVAVVGSTEEGAVDEVHEIVRLRERYAEKGISFYLHVDAAYGGYARALFLDGESRRAIAEGPPAELRDHGPDAVRAFFAGGRSP